MRSLLLSTTAAFALLAGGIAADANTTGKDGIQLAQAGGDRQMGQGGGSMGGGSMGGTTGQGAPGSSGMAPGSRKDESTSRTGEAPGPRKDEAPGQQRTQQQKDQKDQQRSGQMQKDQKDQQRTGQTQKDQKDQKDRTTTGQGQRDNMKDQQRGTTGQQQQQQQGTTGQAGAGAAGAQLSQQQRTEVVQKFKTTNLRRVDNVNFSISVGTVVPQTVTFYEIPSEIIEVVPAWRRYRYIVVREQILIIDPDTRRIIAVLEV